MVITDRQTLAGLYPSMLWTITENKEAKAILTADRKTLISLHLRISSIYTESLFFSPG